MKKTPTKNDMQSFIDADFTVADIAIYNEWGVSKVRYWLKKFDLKATRETGSIGAKAFKVLLQHAFPAFPIEEEYHIGNRLRLDFYIPGLYTAFEVDGDPHNELVGLFHTGEEKKFQEARARDKVKDVWCEENNILLIRITSKLAVETRLNPECRVFVVDSIRDQIAEAAPTGPVVEKKEEVVSERYARYREDMKILSREARKKSYRKAKAIKDRFKKEAKEAKRNALQGD
jgi:hypothetical protein